VAAQPAPAAAGGGAAAREERPEEAGGRGDDAARGDAARVRVGIRGAADADVGVARGGAAGEGGHHAQVHEPGERPARIRERALLMVSVKFGCFDLV